MSDSKKRRCEEALWKQRRSADRYANTLTSRQSTDYEIKCAKAKLPLVLETIRNTEAKLSIAGGQ